jgi:hypothetical protein
MRKILFVMTMMLVILSTPACIQDKIDGVVDECQTFVEQAEEDIWARCSDEMDEFLLELQKWFEERIGEVKEETLTELGCVPTTGYYGWDCTDSPICKSSSGQ